MIPTAITTYRITKTFKEDGYQEATLSKAINSLNKEVLAYYARPHIVIRWSPLSVAIDRLLQCFKQGG